MFHRVTIIGNLGRDPEMRYTQDGTPVASFSVAATKKWKTQDGSQREKTVWFRVSACSRANSSSLWPLLFQNHSR